VIKLLDIRYVRLGTGNLDLADGYAHDVLGLELARSEAGDRYIRSDNRDHTLVYFEGDPRDHAVGFELRTADELEAASTELSNFGIEVRPGFDGRVRQRRVKFPWADDGDHAARRYGIPSRIAGQSVQSLR
jgi:2,3-dihydroxy-p-cumate/2,3-dihydroxybenzoate 3,4-dioxygenase